MRSMIASRAIAEHPDINATPVLLCEGKCRDITAHELSHLELSYAYEPEDPPALILIYRCDTCGKRRNWGRLAWAEALKLDPDLADNIGG